MLLEKKEFFMGGPLSGDVRRVGAENFATDSKHIISGDGAVRDRLIIRGADHPALRIACRVLGDGEHVGKGVTGRLRGLVKKEVEVKIGGQRVALSIHNLAKRLLVSPAKIKKMAREGKLEAWLASEAVSRSGEYKGLEVESRVSNFVRRVYSSDVRKVIKDSLSKHLEALSDNSFKQLTIFSKNIEIMKVNGRVFLRTKAEVDKQIGAGVNKIINAMALVPKKGRAVNDDTKGLIRERLKRLAKEDVMPAQATVMGITVKVSLSEEGRVFEIVE